MMRRRGTFASWIGGIALGGFLAGAGDLSGQEEGAAERRDARSSTPTVTVIEVVDARSGRAVPDRWIRVVRPRGSALVDVRRHADGRFALGPWSGTISVRIGAPGYATAVVTLAAPPAEAVTRVALEPAPFELPEIAAIVRREPPGRVHVLKREADELRGPDLAEWLRELPGFDVVSRGAGGPTAVSVRGSRPQAVEVTLDGVPLGDPLTGVADLSLVPASTIEGAVARAGTGGTAGWGGTAGSVHLRSLDARPGVRAGLSVGSFGRVGTDAELGLEGAGVRVSALVLAAMAENDFPFENRIRTGAPSERRANADRESWGALARVALEAIPVTVIARHDGVDRGAPGRMGSELWDRARWSESVTALGASWGDAWVPGGSGARFALSWSGRDQTYSDARVDRVETLRADQLVASGEGRLPGAVDLAWRGTWSRVAGDVLAAPASRLAGGIRAARTVTLGGPVDLDATLAADAAPQGLALSPGLAVSWQVGDGARVWARAGQGYRLPTFADLFLRPGTGALPNPDLLPERVRVDAGVGADIGSSDGFRATGGAFYRHTRDPIIWLPSVVSVWRPLNAGRLTAWGVEGRLEWRPARTLEVTAAATWQESRLAFEDYSNPLPYHPRVSGHVGVERRGAGPDVRAALEFRGARRSSVYGPHELAPFAILNVRAREGFDVAGVEAVLEVGVSNVLDVAYERVELFPEPGRSVELRLEVRPRRPRGLQADTANRSFRAGSSSDSDPIDVPRTTGSR